MYHTDACHFNFKHFITEMSVAGGKDREYRKGEEKDNS